MFCQAKNKRILIFGVIIVMQSGHFPVEVSSIYRLLVLEKGELEKLKWIESEKAKRDIGLDNAIIIWTTKHRNGWLRAIRTSGSIS